MNKLAAIAFAICVLGVAATAAGADSFFRQWRVDTLVGEGIDLYHHGEYADSIDKFDAALELEPQDVSARYDRALDLYALGKYDAAAVELRACLQTEPDFVPALFNLGVTDLALSDVAGAQAIFAQIIATHPDSVRAHFDLGLSHFVEGKPD
ncbi:MAG: tetratricopeptide repeat protein, partial [Candidatus Eremiobacteraeota bacterium]|nr:tetratricopeptide repeat protein [Candidatus Eremiobacteraeota bacterium]